jgi:hypothetical protein
LQTQDAIVERLAHANSRYDQGAAEGARDWLPVRPLARRRGSPAPDRPTDWRRAARRSKTRPWRPHSRRRLRAGSH